MYYIKTYKSKLIKCIRLTRNNNHGHVDERNKAFQNSNLHGRNWNQIRHSMAYLRHVHYRTKAAVKASLTRICLTCSAVLVAVEINHRRVFNFAKDGEVTIVWSKIYITFLKEIEPKQSRFLWGWSFDLRLHFRSNDIKFECFIIASWMSQMKTNPDTMIWQNFR